MRLIDADELKKRIPITHADEFENCRNCSLLCDWEVENLVDDAPTIDAVEVVRCKDCKWWLDSDHTCHEHSLVSPMTANDFCSRAERRSDEQQM